MWSRGAIVGGAALGFAADLVLRRRLPRARLAAQAVGLVAAAGVYPALHAGPTEADERRRETAGVAATGVVVVLAGVLASRLSRRARGRRVLAAGWAAHALFDAVHHRGETSLLPDWYPAACAGYDLTTAALILAPARSRRGPKPG